MWNHASFILSLTTILASSIPLSLNVDKHDHAAHEQPDLPDKAVVVLQSMDGYDVQGTLMLTKKGENVQVSGEIKGLTPGQHGFHIHQYGDLRAADGKSAGGHFNPDGVDHGGPDDKHHHAGDLGNIEADKNGVAKVNKTAKGLKLHFVIGRSIVVHAGVDDLKSQPSGDAGPRAAVGVIGIAESK
ncbi:superoxide dismutase family protein [uncultured Rubinisphaera sp.]|uniref:superoxide dismutase family protein n=1 Tax=uncultured Rubinisphaera sp. TaxID=1678686 RepID=UPI0030DB4170